MDLPYFMATPEGMQIDVLGSKIRSAEALPSR